MAMTGWGASEPAWWLNLQAHPEAVVELAGGIRRRVLSRAAARRGAVSACGAHARTGREPRRLRCTTPARDRGRRLRAAPPLTSSQAWCGDCGCESKMNTGAQDDEKPELIGRDAGATDGPG